MRLFLPAYAGFTTVLIGFLLYILFTAPIPRLARFPEGDSVQRGTAFDIVCTAYSNRPSETLQPPFDERYVGFRMVSDCVTVAR